MILWINSLESEGFHLGLCLESTLGQRNFRDTERFSIAQFSSCSPNKSPFPKVLIVVLVPLLSLNVNPIPFLNNSICSIGSPSRIIYLCSAKTIGFISFIISSIFSSSNSLSIGICQWNMDQGCLFLFYQFTSQMYQAKLTLLRISQQSSFFISSMNGDGNTSSSVFKLTSFFHSNLSLTNSFEFLLLLEFIIIYPEIYFNIFLLHRPPFLFWS